MIKRGLLTALGIAGFLSLVTTLYPTQNKHIFSFDISNMLKSNRSSVSLGSDEIGTSDSLPHPTAPKGFYYDQKAWAESFLGITARKGFDLELRAKDSPEKVYGKASAVYEIGKKWAIKNSLPASESYLLANPALTFETIAGRNLD